LPIFAVIVLPAIADKLGNSRQPLAFRAALSFWHTRLMKVARW
jgi:hypothetical protein